jgi:hypothetical protein
MKEVKTQLATLMIVSVIVSTLAFKGSKPPKPFTPTVYYFSGAHDNISLLRQNEIRSTINWSTGVGAFGTSNFLTAIDFVVDPDTVPDGGSDGALTLQEAIDELWYYYDHVNNNFPTYHFTVGAAGVNIYRKP